jgi:competence protein ComFC
MNYSFTKERPTYKIYKLLWTGLDWLFPPTCGGCQQAGTRWCPSCQSRTVLILPPVCTRCGCVLTRSETCSSCRGNTKSFAMLRSWAEFNGPLRNALHRLKYQNDLGLGETFSKYLLTLFEILAWEVDFILPVPLSPSRKAERGYNQASMLARPLALATGIEYQPGALKKVRETPSQVGLTMSQRRENVCNAFEARMSIVSGKRILLVDDICTSGATIDSCSRALIECGAKEVFAITLARAPQIRS